MAVSRPPWTLATAPPAAASAPVPTAWLLVKVIRSSVRWPPLFRTPPPRVTGKPEPTELVSVSPVALPLATVRLSSVTLVPATLMSKTRTALAPLTVSRSAPGPSIVTSPVMFSSLLSGMAPCRPGAKLMASGPAWALASRTAWRSDPGPLSFRFLTVKVLGTVRSSRAVSRGTKGRRAARARPAGRRRERRRKVNNIGYLVGENGSASGDCIDWACRPGAQTNAGRWGAPPASASPSRQGAPRHRPSLPAAESGAGTSFPSPGRRPARTANRHA